MAYCVVKIDGTEVQVVKDTLAVDLRIEERSIAEFTIADVLGTATYQRGQPIEIYDIEDVLVFGGFIEYPDTVRLSPKTGLYHPIRCIDNHYLADKRLVAESFLATDAGDIVAYIRTNYLAVEGVTVGTIETGPEIKEAVFNYVRASDCFDALAEKSNKIWYIDENKALYFVARDTTLAPWNAEPSDIVKGTAHLSEGNPLYRNRQYTRGGWDTTALQTETFIGDGEQVAFTVGFPIAKEPTSVKVNAVGQTIGRKGLDVAKQCYWDKGDATITFATAPPDTQEVEVKYYGQFNILTLVEDSNEIAAQSAVEGGGTGYVEAIGDELTLNDKDASIDAGLAKLTRFGVQGKRFLYQVTRTGLKPGMLHTVNYPSLGLTNEELLIESVMMTGRGSSPTYDIVGIQGPEIGSWSKFFKALADMKQEAIEFLNIGSDQILILLVDFTGDVEVSETISDVIWACALVDSGKVDEATIC